MFQEFQQFTKVIDSHDLEFTNKQLQRDEIVMHVVDQALADSQIKLG
jgi:hypothetical protein